MSTLVVSNISDGTTTVGASYVMNGSAKAWGKVSYGGGGTPSLGSNSLNISSVSDDSTGQHTLSFSSAFDSNDYAWVSTCHEDRIGLCAQADNATYTASAVKVMVQDSRDATLADWGSSNTCHGDLA
jgi:hypothetical protein